MTVEQDSHVTQMYAAVILCSYWLCEI